VAPGSARLQEVSIFLPPGSALRPFTADPDGRIGQFAEDRPYDGSFPQGWAVRVLDDDTAFVDRDGNGAYDPASEHVLTRAADDTLLLTYAGTTVAREQDLAGFRLNLQRTIVINPAAPADYVVVFSLNSVCGDLGLLQTIVSIRSPACVPDAALDDLSFPPWKVRVVRAADGTLSVLWNGAVPMPDPADPCAARFALYGGENAAMANVATSIPFHAEWVNLSGEDEDGSLLDEGWTGQSDYMYYLVVREGPEGEVGPVGHYGL
jgi:hypothetical protein